MEIVESSPEVMGGTPVFKGTRVPLQTFHDYIDAGDSTDEFLDDFPTVSKEQVEIALQMVRSPAVAVTRL